MPPPRPAMEARSGSLSQAEPGLISQYASSSRPAAHAARRPDVRHRRQTDVRQHHRLMPPARGHNNSGKRTKCLPLVLLKSQKSQTANDRKFDFWTLDSGPTEDQDKFHDRLDIVLERFYMQ